LKLKLFFPIIDRFRLDIIRSPIIQVE